MEIEFIMQRSFWRKLNYQSKDHILNSQWFSFLFLQPARMNPFGRAEKKHAEEVRRDHEYLKKQ
jgi:hypothetical protein